MPSIPQKDRNSLCAFSFRDGRRCRTPRIAKSWYCHDHARKEAQAEAAASVGRDVRNILSSGYISACDLTSALGRVFSAVAQGHFKPRTASTLAFLGQTMVQSLDRAEHEYCNAFGAERWRHTLRASLVPPPPLPPAPPPRTLPAPQPQPAVQPAASANPRPGAAANSPAGGPSSPRPDASATTPPNPAAATPTNTSN